MMATRTNPQHIFISHSSLDNDEAKSLYQALTQDHQLACWMDLQNLKADQGPFPEQIVKAIFHARALVLLDLPAAQQSHYVSRELQLAKDRRIPIYRYRPVKAPFLRNLNLRRLSFSLQLRAVRPLIATILILILVLVSLSAAVFYMGTQVVPVLASSGFRDLPDAFRPTPTMIPFTAVPTPSDPKIIAPFHFKTDYSILMDDFNDSRFQNGLNPEHLFYDLKPEHPDVKVGQENERLSVYFPVECLEEKFRWDCSLQLNSNFLDVKRIQYFGFRARSVSKTALRGVSISISVSDPGRNRVGFGWNFTDQATAFFRPAAALPEKGLYAFVKMDHRWHTYEILREVQSGKYSYYVDGQLIEQYISPHIQEWETAPLQLIIYSLKANGYEEEKGVETRLEIDEMNIGGFLSNQ